MKETKEINKSNKPTTIEEYVVARLITLEDELEKQKTFVKNSDNQAWLSGGALILIKKDLDTALSIIKKALSPDFEKYTALYPFRTLEKDGLTPAEIELIERAIKELKREKEGESND